MLSVSDVVAQKSVIDVLAEHTTGDDKAGDGTGDRNDSAAVYAAQHGDSP